MRTLDAVAVGSMFLASSRRRAICSWASLHAIPSLTYPSQLLDGEPQGDLVHRAVPEGRPDGSPHVGVADSANSSSLDTSLGSMWTSSVLVVVERVLAPHELRPGPLHRGHVAVLAVPAHAMGLLVDDGGEGLELVLQHTA